MENTRSYEVRNGGSIPSSDTSLSRVRLAAIPPGLGPGFRGFESHMRDQFYLSDVMAA